jgi:hypothetical protein
MFKPSQDIWNFGIKKKSEKRVSRKGAKGAKEKHIVISTEERSRNLGISKASGCPLPGYDGGRTSTSIANFLSRTLESLHRGGPLVGKRKFLLWSLNLVLFLVLGQTLFGAEKLVGLQSAPSIAMALPWFAEEARLHPKYDLDF